MNRDFKIAHVTTVHIPKDTRIFYRECLTLHEAGYRVHLICSESSDNLIPIIHIPLPKIKNKGFRIIISPFLALKACLRSDCQIYHIHDPELIPVGIALKFIKRKVIYDVHEEYTKFFISKDWIPRPLRYVAAKTYALAEYIAAKSFDGIIAATPTIANAIRSSKLEIIHNYPAKDEIEYHEYNPTTRPNSLIYTGNITEIRGLKEMIEIIRKLNVDYKINSKLILCGTFSPPELYEEATRLDGWEYVYYTGYVDRHELSKYLASAKVGIAVLHPTPNHLDSIPNKLFEYMSAGLPIVASNFPIWETILEGNSCGITVDPLNTENAASKIATVLRDNKKLGDMSARGLQAFESDYNWSTERIKLLRLYSAI